MPRRKRPPIGPKKAPAFENRPFAALQPMSKTASATPAAGPATAAPPPPPRADDEEELFHAAMSGVEPIGLRPPPREKPAPPLPERDANEREEEQVREALRRLISGDQEGRLYEPAETIEGLARDADPSLLDRLRAGEFSVQAHLDLHGMDRSQARAAVEAFLEQSARAGQRCLLVIHGRGRGSRGRVPVLKNALAAWLERSALRKRILAFCSARPCDGGAGAVYVLLKG